MDPGEALGQGREVQFGEGLAQLGDVEMAVSDQQSERLQVVSHFPHDFRGSNSGIAPTHV